MTPFELYNQKFQQALAQIGDMEARYGKEAVELQRILYEQLTKNLIDKLDVANGEVMSSAKNYQLLKSFDKTWNDYTKGYFNNSFRRLGEDLAGVTSLSMDYMGALDLPNMGKHYAEAQNLILQMIGMTMSEKGRLEMVPGGYISKLAQGQELSMQLRKLVAQNITVGASYKEFYTTFRQTLLGSDQTNGVMQKYFRTYVYDTFSGVQASYDNYVARSAGMNRFIYAGSLIADSRPFCVSHVNKIYTRADIGKFEKQNWEGKNHSVPFIVARGGYNCRHQLMWIPDEMASTLQPGDIKQPVTEKQAVLPPISPTHKPKPKPVKMPPPKMVKDPAKPTAKNFDEAQRLYGDAMANKRINSDQISALNSYQGSGYRTINKRLRHPQQTEVELSQGNREYIDKNITHIREAINILPKTEGTLYRGSNLSPKTYDDLMKQVNQGYVRDKGFSSASFSEKEAQHFIGNYSADREHPNEVYFVLKAKGKNGVYFGNYNEEEVLFRDNTMFKVTKVEKVKGIMREEQTRIYIEEV